jgi:thiol-disulfide isomerase/thioredoxin
MTALRLSAALLLPVAVAAQTRAGGAVASPATRPTTAPAARAGGLPADFRALGQQYLALFPKVSELADPAQRADKATKAIGIVRRLVGELDGMDPTWQVQYASIRDTYAAVLLALGDGDTRAAVDRDAAGDGAVAVRAKHVATLSQWLLASRDPARQSTMVDDLRHAAEASPTDVGVATFAVLLRQYPATPAVRHQLDDVVARMDNPVATQLRAELNAQARLAANEGQPMVLAGKRPDGTPFTTADWKGRVILVDFWAAWCAPCRAELPRVKKVYAEYHDKGFEVLGIDNDETAKAVIAFAARDGLPWPQLFDAGAGADGKWNPITTGYGIHGIPVMFLIDKKGICRSVEARDDFETVIPKMLTE